MESTNTTTPAVATPAPTTTEPKAIRTARFYAIVQRATTDSTETTIETIEAPRVRELQQKLTNPNDKILAVFRGRKLEFKTQQQISLTLS